MLKVPCPSCRQPAEYSPANPFRPFCGERCRKLDLGAWASESYRLPAAESKNDGMNNDDGASPELH